MVEHTQIKRRHFGYRRFHGSTHRLKAQQMIGTIEQALAGICRDCHATVIRHYTVALFSECLVALLTQYHPILAMPGIAQLLSRDRGCNAFGFQRDRSIVGGVGNGEP